MTTPTETRLAIAPLEAARLLGLCRQTIYNLMRSGEIRYVKIGRATRIPMSEIERIIAGEGRKP